MSDNTSNKNAAALATCKCFLLVFGLNSNQFAVIDFCQLITHLLHIKNELSETLSASGCILTERVGAPQRGDACWSVGPVHFAAGHQVLLRLPQHGWEILVGSCERLDAVLDGAEDLRGTEILFYFIFFFS